MFIRHHKFVFSPALLTLLLCSCYVIEEGTSSQNRNLIRDCPEEKIINKMPSLGSNYNKIYYIYNGQKRELSEFDNEWINEFCDIKVTKVF